MGINRVAKVAPRSHVNKPHDVLCVCPDPDNPRDKINRLWVRDIGLISKEAHLLEIQPLDAHARECEADRDQKSAIADKAGFTLRFQALVTSP
jgi:hypothetical protein